MGKIRILPDTLVSKISAGEVVERPASVVKELIENSIDAKADKISVYLKYGGKRHIKIVDNGIGMTRDDALMSLERHATSKIKDVGDLFSLSTLGFRGEAIPSISSVSRLNIVTKTHDQENGVEIISEGGVVKKVREIACKTGTSIDVNNLFFNTPVRLKFLKTPKTELMRVMEIVQREALCKPEVTFELFDDEKNIHNFKSTQDIKERICAVIPNTELYEFEHKSSEINVTGHLSGPSETRTSMQKLYTYVNKRPVRDRFINRMIMDSYGNLIEKGKYPQGVLFIEIDPEDVDVNVHPTKFEVKFKNQYHIGEFIKESIRSMLNSAPWIKGYKQRTENALKNFYSNQKEDKAQSFSGFSEPKFRSTENKQDYSQNNAFESVTSYTPNEPVENEVLEKNEELISTGYYSGLKLVGQVGKLYLVCETSEGMIVVDQHAAHERVNFERIKKAYLEDNSIHSQQLLLPEILEITPQESSTVNTHLNDINRLGFGVEQFGENTFRLLSVPGFLVSQSYKEIFLNLVDEIYNFGKGKSVNEKLDLVCATIACHSSIRANQKLSSDEIFHLFRDLDKCDAPHSCPHGRPIATEISYNMLEKLFRRI